MFAAHDEALGLAPLEAMARECPVVAVGESGVRETVVDGVTGFLTPRDPSVFAARLEQLVSDDGQAQRMGAAGRREVERRWAWGVRATALKRELVAVAASNRTVGMP